VEAEISKEKAGACQENIPPIGASKRGKSDAAQQRRSTPSQQRRNDGRSAHKSETVLDASRTPLPVGKHCVSNSRNQGKE
jgi:hypothetical protein